MSVEHSKLEVHFSVVQPEPWLGWIQTVPGIPVSCFAGANK